MTWNYRVLTTEYQGVVEYSLHEVYYNEKGEPTSCTVEPVTPYSSEGLEDFKLSMQLMMYAFDKPVLKYEDFV